MQVPISGKEVTLRELRGAEELLLLRGNRSAPHLARELLAAVLSGAETDALPVGDAEALLLELRRTLIGDVVQATLICPAQSCCGRLDLSFSITAYVAHHRPHRVRAVTDEGDGWLTDGSGMAFRLPTLLDQVEVSGSPAADTDLLQRCLRAPAAAALQGRVQRMMERIAPTMSDYVGGSCPICGTAIEVYFDVEQFVLRELRDGASALHDDIHLIASRYGWSEEAVLALPRSRRAAYAERISEEAAA